MRIKCTLQFYCLLLTRYLGSNQLASNRYTYRHGKIAPFNPFALKLAIFPRFLMCPLLVGNQDGHPPMRTVASLSATPTSLCSLPAAPASSLSAKPRFQSVEGSVMQGCTPGGLSTRLPKNKNKRHLGSISQRTFMLNSQRFNTVFIYYKSIHFI